MQWIRLSRSKQVGRIALASYPVREQIHYKIRIIVYKSLHQSRSDCLVQHCKAVSSIPGYAPSSAFCYLQWSSNPRNFQQHDAVLAAFDRWRSLPSYQTDASLVSWYCEFSCRTPDRSSLRTGVYRLRRNVAWTGQSLTWWLLTTDGKPSFWRKFLV